MAKKQVQSKSSEKTQAASNSPSRDEQIGYHKGSIMTLSKERQELVRILGIVEQLMQMHASALQELGVKLEGEAQQAVAQPQSAAPKAKKPPIEDIL